MKNVDVSAAVDALMQISKKGSSGNGAFSSLEGRRMNENS